MPRWSIEKWHQTCGNLWYLPTAQLGARDSDSLTPHSLTRRSEPSLSELDRRREGERFFLWPQFSPRREWGDWWLGWVNGERDIGLNWDRWPGREMEAAVKATTRQALKQRDRRKARKSYPKGLRKFHQRRIATPETLSGLIFLSKMLTSWKQTWVRSPPQNNRNAARRDSTLDGRARRKKRKVRNLRGFKNEGTWHQEAVVGCLDAPWRLNWGGAVLIRQLALIILLLL